MVPFLRIIAIICDSVLYDIVDTIFKNKKSCDNLKRQNFVPGFVAGNTAPFMRMRNQCKPDYRLQVARRRYGNTQSVCRQCFSMCSNENAASAEKCFGGLGDSSVFTAAATNDAKIGAAQVNMLSFFQKRRFLIHLLIHNKNP